MIRDELFLNEEDVQHIWGIPSHNVNSIEDCKTGLYSLTDLELLFWPETKTYTVSVETIYFTDDNSDDGVEYLQKLLKLFTDWMVSQGLDIAQKPALYNAFDELHPRHFKTIEEAYTDFKMRVIGYCSILKEVYGC